MDDDCEDQGFSNIEDGCTRCVTDEVVKNSAGLEVLKRMPLIKNRGFWVCPGCHGSYGRVNAPPL